MHIPPRIVRAAHGNGWRLSLRCWDAGRGPKFCEGGSALFVCHVRVRGAQVLPWRWAEQALPLRGGAARRKRGFEPIENDRMWRQLLVRAPPGACPARRQAPKKTAATDRRTQYVGHDILPLSASSADPKTVGPRYIGPLPALSCSTRVEGRDYRLVFGRFRS